MTDETTDPTEATQPETQPEAVRPRRERRKASLVLGRWQEGCFVALPSEYQPTGRAAREIKALRKWVISREVALKMGAFEFDVEVVRKEPLAVGYVTSTVVKAKVR